MRPVLRFADSPDVDDLASFRPPVDEPWSVFVELSIGPEGGRGEELFSLTICNGLYLQEKAGREGPQLISHHLVLGEYDWRVAESFIRRQLDRFVADTWEEVAVLVGRMAYWEFADYQGAD